MGSRKTGFNLMLGATDRKRLEAIAKTREVSRGEVLRSLLREAVESEGGRVVGFPGRR